jgi:hypothetical protein
MRRDPDPLPGSGCARRDRARLAVGDESTGRRCHLRMAHVTPLLAGFKGVLHSDAYPAYAAFARENQSVICVGCWAHTRRRFHEVLEEAPVQAGFVLRLIGHLYAMEAQWDAKKTAPQERALLRQRDFSWTLSLLKKVAALLAARVRPTSRLGAACSYLLAQWEPLTRHLQHGQTRLDTNVARTPSGQQNSGRKTGSSSAGCPHAFADHDQPRRSCRPAAVEMEARHCSLEII